MFADNIQIIGEPVERFLKTENILLSEWSLCGRKTVVFSTYLLLWGNNMKWLIVTYRFLYFRFRITANIQEISSALLATMSLSRQSELQLYSDHV